MNTHLKYSDWTTNTPPKNTWVWAAYSLVTNDWQLVKTCKNGCCVHSIFGTMTLPNFWHLATEYEGIKEQAQWDSIPQINMFDLYQGE